MHFKESNVSPSVHLSTSLLVGVSSLGLVALLVAFVVLLLSVCMWVLMFSYGGIHWGISWDNSVLFPESLMGVLANIGIIINAFGFLLCLFPLYVCSAPRLPSRTPSKLLQNLTSRGVSFSRSTSSPSYMSSRESSCSSCSVRTPIASRKPSS